MAKSYVGTRKGGEAQVKVYGVEDRQPIMGYQLPHIALHSPDGFEWGYGGSGPADLALAILADYFEEPADLVLAAARSMWAPRSKAVALHQDFKAYVVAHLAGPAWKIPVEQIEAWLKLTPNVEALAHLAIVDADLEAIREAERDAQDAELHEPAEAS